MPAYVFYLDLTTPETFYLDSHTKKEVIPFELEKGMLYRIGYEARSNIIVAIEPISEEIMEQDEAEDERQISSYEYES